MLLIDGLLLGLMNTGLAHRLGIQILDLQEQTFLL